MSTLKKAALRFKKMHRGGHHWSQTRAELIALQSTIAVLRTRGISSESLTRKLTAVGGFDAPTLEMILTPTFSLEEALEDEDEESASLD